MEIPLDEKNKKKKKKKTSNLEKIPSLSVTHFKHGQLLYKIPRILVTYLRFELPSIDRYTQGGGEVYSRLKVISIVIQCNLFFFVFFFYLVSI